MKEQDTTALRIVCVGPEFHGSDSGGLGRAIRHLGHLVQIVDDTKYSLRFSTRNISRAFAKIFRPMAIREMGREIVRQCEHCKPHFVLVCKGSFVEPWVLRELKQKGIYLFNFYPDVSFMAHGRFFKC